MVWVMFARPFNGGARTQQRPSTPAGLELLLERFGLYHRRLDLMALARPESRIGEHGDQPRANSGAHRLPVNERPVGQWQQGMVHDR